MAVGDCTISGNVSGHTFTVTQDDLNGVTAGTVTASKAVVVDANKRVDTLVIGTLALGAGAGTAVTSTAAELNILDGVTATAAEINAFCDQSAGVQAITGAGAVTVDGTINRATLSGGAYAITLAAPDAAAVGKFLIIEYVGGDTDEVTLALTNVIGGSAATSAAFNADDEALLLYGLANKWLVVKEVGVTLT